MRRGFAPISSKAWRQDRNAGRDRNWGGKGRSGASCAVFAFWLPGATFQTIDYSKVNEEDRGLLRRTERQIFSYDLMILARARHAMPPPLSDIVAAWQTMFNLGECSHVREKGSVIYRIGDLSVDNAAQVASILLRRCDTNAANAVYSHKVTGVPRIVEQEDDEGGDRAAHLVVSLRNERGKPASYLCHLEGVPGLSHRLVQATLNAVLKQSISNARAVFSYPDPGGARDRDGNPKTTNFIPSIEMVGHPSPALVNDIELGQLHDITLVDQRPQNQLGGNQYLVENERRLKVKAAPNMPSHGRVQSLIAAFQTRRADFQRAKVRFTDPDGINRTIDYDIATGTPEQQNYVRSYKVTGINPPMDESSVSLAPFLGAAMRARVMAERS